MDLATTLTLLIAALAVIVVSHVMLRRPRPFGRVWTVPYNGLQFVAILIAIAMAAHLVTLLTGKPFAGRMGD